MDYNQGRGQGQGLAGNYYQKPVGATFQPQPPTPPTPPSSSSASQQYAQYYPSNHPQHNYQNAQANADHSRPYASTSTYSHQQNSYHQPPPQPLLPPPIPPPPPSGAAMPAFNNLSYAYQQQQQRQQPSPPSSSNHNHHYTPAPPRSPSLPPVSIDGSSFADAFGYATTSPSKSSNYLNHSTSSDDYNTSRDSMNGIISLYGSHGSSSPVGSSPPISYGYDSPSPSLSPQVQPPPRPPLPTGAAAPYTNPNSSSSSGSLYRSQSQAALPPLRPSYPTTSQSAATIPTVSNSNSYSNGLPSHPGVRRPSNPNTSDVFPPQRPHTTYSPPLPSLSERVRRPSHTSPTPPSDAFYTPAPPPAIPPFPDTPIRIPPPERKESLERNRQVAMAAAAVQKAAGGDWRSGLPIEEERRPSRQPTILTTPPIGSGTGSGSGGMPPPTRRTTYGARNASLSSTPSTSTIVSPTVNSYSQQTLSPNTSYTGSFALTRNDSENDGDAHEFLNPALLSNIAVFVRDKVPKGVRAKGAVEYDKAFTGDELVNTILLTLPPSHNTSRSYALHIARSLQQSLYFHEVDWSDLPLKDAQTGKVYLFPQDESMLGGGGEGSTIIGGGDEEEEELPTGVLTSLTGCMSPMCGKINEETGGRYACYSYSCPNKEGNELHRHPSMVSTHSAAETAEEAESWMTSVPQSVVDSLDKDEVQRQGLIFEVVKTEQEYLNDLELIETAFVARLRESNPPIIPPERLESFLLSILSNIGEIRAHSKNLLANLLARQKEQYPVIKQIGEVILPCALDWGPAYYNYTVRFPMGDWYFREEQHKNARFRELLMDFQRVPAVARRGFDTFHSRPTMRAMRYSLLLESIAKKTASNNPDKEILEECIRVINQQSKEADLAIGDSKTRVACWSYQRDLTNKAGQPVDLDLLSEGRRHYLSSKAYRKSESGISEWSESFLILFDHLLVTTKPARKDRDDRNKYQITRRPVPLDLITLRPSSFSEPAVPRSTGFHLRSNRHAGDNAGPASQQETSLVYPISFHQIGRNEGLVTYYVESQAARTEWEKKLKEAVEARHRAQQATQVVRLETLSDQTFGAAQAFGSLHPAAPTDSQFGRPTCSVPLTTHNGPELVMVGCAGGLFIGYRGKPQSMRKVLHLADITQCAVMHEFGFVLIVASKVLIAYPLEALVPSGNGKVDPASKAPQRLSGQKDVLFFRVGKVGDGDPRTLVIYVKKSGVKESVFKALEPVSHAEQRGGGGGGRGFLGFGQNRSDSFRTYKDFFLPSMAFSVQFLRSKLAIVCSKGVEIMNLETLRTMSVPDFSASRGDSFLGQLAKRCEEAKTLGMFRLQDNDFLLAYDEFAFHVDKHGEPLPGHSIGLIEWESKPEAVAYHAPYIFAFSSSIIEIRNAFTSRLAQFIVGSNIVLTYDGSNIEQPVIDIRRPGSSLSGTPSEGDGTSPDKRLHVTMKVNSYHQLFEIVPV